MSIADCRTLRREVLGNVPFGFVCSLCATLLSAKIIGTEREGAIAKWWFLRFSSTGLPAFATHLASPGSQGTTSASPDPTPHQTPWTQPCCCSEPANCSQRSGAAAPDRSGHAAPQAPFLQKIGPSLPGIRRRTAARNLDEKVEVKSVTPFFFPAWK